MVVAIIGLPGGIEPQHDSLKQLVQRGTIAFYEIIGREIVLYWRGMQASSKTSFNIDVTAAVPGQYTVSESVS